MHVGGAYTAIAEGYPGAVAPGAAFGRAGTRKDRRMGRASALVLVCGLAACVALLGSLGDAEEPVNQAFLAVKAELQDKPAIQLKGKSMALAAKANSLASTASGIMEEAAHSKVGVPQGQSHMSAAKASVAAAKSILKGVPKISAKVSKQALDEAPAEAPPVEEAPAEEAPAEEAPAEGEAAAAEGGDSPADDTSGSGEKKKVLGASGEEVFGKQDGAVAGFLGFESKGEPNVLGIPLPVVMILFVTCVTITCLTVGCLIARKTDILKVNKEEVGGAAKPVDEHIEDDRGYDWRNKD